MNPKSRVYIAGHNGLVGSAIARILKKNGYENIYGKSHQELNLESYSDLDSYFNEICPEYIFIAAAKVGGIFANNSYPVDFLLSNLKVQTNLIELAHKYNAKRLIFLGSSCIYPKNSPQPIKEDALLSGQLESTNRPYALAKITGIEMCWSYNRQYGTKYLSVMPTNLYGLNDSYHQDNSHVIPALIRKIHEAKKRKQDYFEIWGSGNPRREFLFSDDLAEALFFLMTLNDNSFDKLIDHSLCPIINIGFGNDMTIKETALKIAKVVGFTGDHIFDKTKPDGTFQKLLDSSRIKNIGWKPRVDFESGISIAYQDFLKNHE